MRIRSLRGIIFLDNKFQLIKKLQKGIKNLNKHLDNLKNVFGLNVIV